MPFGYAKYLEDNGKSQETVKSYTKVINMFIAYLDTEHGKDYEMYEVKTRDIRGYLESKRAANNVPATLNKHLTVLKSFFDYLWQIEKVPINPTTKMKSYKATDNEIGLLDYEILLEIKPYVLKNPNYSIKRKALFILLLHGIRYSEFEIKRKNVIEKNGDVIIIFKNHEPVQFQGPEADILLAHMDNMAFHTTDYVFITKKHDGTTVPIQIAPLNIHLIGIEKDYNVPSRVTLDKVRYAYAYYLYTQKNKSIEDISTIFGIQVKAAVTIIQNSEYRYRKGKESVEQ